MAPPLSGMDRAILHELGFELGARAPAGESDEGAWFATSPEGAPVVLKWFRDETRADRYEVLLPALDVLRARGVPVPEYPYVLTVDGWTLAAQERLPGHPWESEHGHGARAALPHLVERVLECVAAAEGVDGPRPSPSLATFGDLVVHSLTVGEDGWCVHAPLRSWSARTAALLDRIEAVAADADPTWFPSTGLVHLDLHTGNVLAEPDGTLTGIIDWEGASVGDQRVDALAFAFDLDGAGQQIWDLVDPFVEDRVLRAYAAHLALRGTDWAIRHHPDDVARQLDRAERVLGRYGA